jgi:guanosine-3',5'-bis(diphosphate) 3'-pyrophosphohydrolase
VGTFTEMPSAIGTSAVVHDAYDLLVSKHAGQRQRVNGRPYVEHPVLVATDVSRAGFDPEMVAAALLHDIVEDSDVSVDDLQERFGRRVSVLVEAMTDDVEVEPYERRKALHREQVVAAGPEAAAIFAADKLNNVRALRSAYAEHGEAVAGRFKQPLDTKLRVWVADAEMVSSYAAAVPYAQVLVDEVEGLQADRLNRRRRG